MGGDERQAAEEDVGKGAGSGQGNRTSDRSLDRSLTIPAHLGSHPLSALSALVIVTGILHDRTSATNISALLASAAMRSPHRVTARMEAYADQ